MPATARTSPSTSTFSKASVVNFIRGIGTSSISKEAGVEAQRCEILEDRILDMLECAPSLRDCRARPFPVLYIWSDKDEVSTITYPDSTFRDGTFNINPFSNLMVRAREQYAKPPKGSSFDSPLTFKSKDSSHKHGGKSKSKSPKHCKQQAGNDPNYHQFDSSLREYRNDHPTTPKTPKTPKGSSHKKTSSETKHTPPHAHSNKNKTKQPTTPKSPKPSSKNKNKNKFNLLPNLNDILPNSKRHEDKQHSDTAIRKTKSNQSTPPIITVRQNKKGKYKDEGAPIRCLYLHDKRGERYSYD